MNRLAALFALSLPLLFAAAPAYGVMLRPEKTAVPDFFWPSQLASGDEPPCSQDCIREGWLWGYDPAPDVRVGPNLYAYVKQNPWTSFDPEGLWAFFDDVCAMAIGAVVGVAVQAATDVWHGKSSDWEDYAAAAVGGAAAGEAALYTGGLASGAAYGATANLTRQGLKNLTGKQDGFDGKSFLVETGVCAVGGKLGEVVAPYLSREVARSMTKSVTSSAAETVASAEARALGEAGGRTGTNGLVLTAEGKAYNGLSEGAVEAAGGQAAPLHPRVQAALDSAPHPRPGYHSSCGEPQAASAALFDGASLEGAKFAASYIRSPANAKFGANQPICSSCEHMARVLTKPASTRLTESALKTTGSAAASQTTNEEDD
jgi:hypothetical protein